MPKISVVIPLYNKEKSIASTLQTVLNQTFTDYEIVIVNDGSTDNSVAEVEKIHDARIRLINQQNAGVSAARNRGVEEAKGELIAFLDADDEWKSEYLATQYHLSQKYPECSVFACNYEFHDAEGNVTPTNIHKLPFVGEDGILINYFEVASCSHPPLCTIAVMIRKNVLQAIGGFPVGVTLGEDLITWARLAVYYKIAFSKQVVAVYNFRSQKQLVIPRRAPDKNDTVGKLYEQLTLACDDPALKKIIALWHKMRMVTFVRLGMKNEARYEYTQICKFVKPDKKVVLWNILNFLPLPVLRFILYQVAKLRK
ncbi:glycosyl transferase [Alistipes sp. An116]|uniref:glycosyltransferase family 2 protein n=1 Tax=Alistipes sp. An116 TaxID=1965546 RepID=UPI000B38E0A0|nr:glycosyltransferase family A protein [Alistipes sp. An116]OUQ51588.1 glycosyl transferase [Alistipes sp. An116]